MVQVVETKDLSSDVPACEKRVPFYNYSSNLTVTCSTTSKKIDDPLDTLLINPLLPFMLADARTRLFTKKTKMPYIRFPIYQGLQTLIVLGIPHFTLANLLLEVPCNHALLEKTGQDPLVRNQTKPGIDRLVDHLVSPTLSTAIECSRIF